ncbi:uncharacterized protein [Zea mays]|uniref:uncharacterized protein n=1 Tax=Zea mays TaxID=4577 RepID=UPI0009A9C53F|nr:uncharacterized protein LOC109945542 [Zea mays]|eukprot:XP_020407455.1 uncharacterized protein LOC109945542 [Zea mays]
MVAAALSAPPSHSKAPCDALIPACPAPLLSPPMEHGARCSHLWFGRSVTGSATMAPSSLALAPFRRTGRLLIPSPFFFLCPTLPLLPGIQSRELDAPMQPTPSSSHGRAPPALSLSSAWRPYFPAVQLLAGSPPRRQLGVRAGTAGAYPHDAQQLCCPLPMTRRLCSAPSPGSIAPRSRISPAAPSSSSELAVAHGALVSLP